MLIQASFRDTPPNNQQHHYEARQATTTPSTNHVFCELKKGNDYVHLKISFIMSYT